MSKIVHECSQETKIPIGNVDLTNILDSQDLIRQLHEADKRHSTQKMTELEKQFSEWSPIKRKDVSKNLYHV